MAQNTVICIARQFGSGGHELGLALAQALDIPFYDKELLRVAAEKSGILHELFEKADEQPVDRTQANFTSECKASNFESYINYLPNEKMHLVISEVIREVAAQSSCVIIRRCADYILRRHPGTFSVFLHADLEMRIKRIARLHNIDEDAARSLVKKTDRSRANYYNFYTDREWDSADNYDLAINLGRLGIAKSVELIQQAVPLFTTI